VEGGHELDLVDQAVLQRQQAEEQVSVNGDSGQESASRRVGGADGRPPP
jgi:hypothetical protein